jgi:glycosyltransferase involved in cell wall biosynthesis
MSRQKLTALIPAGNEERHLAECIATVRFADEVLVVVDAASTDRTEAIARELADRVLVHEYVNSAAQKNWAIPQAAHPWVLIVDCDERVTPELQADVMRVLENDGPEDGYQIHRINHFAEQRINGCGWQRDDVLRLFRRDRGRYEEKSVHADIVSADGQPLKVGRLHGQFLHYTFESFSQYLRKYGRYAAWAGEDRARTTKRVTLAHLAVRPALRFLRQYVMYGGFRDGLAGFIICWMAAHSVFLKYAHVWEMQKKDRGTPK